ncbi:MAG: MFS transporter [Desulfobacteraceae bacterium]|nr:MFS transporter [Desulfobacteraceae bacterium]
MNQYFSRLTRKSADIYWGWFVVFGAFGMLSLTYGARYCFGVFTRPMFVEYNWPMSVISLGASINLFVYALIGIFTGRLLDKVAPRWILTVGAIITALGFASINFIRTPMGLFFSYGLLCGIGTACAGVVVNNAAVGKWFLRKRGLAMGISSMGIGFGTMILTPLAGYIVKHYPWRIGFIFISALIFVFGILISQAFMGKPNPESLGLLPDGKRADKKLIRSDTLPSKAEKISIKPLLKNTRFWILALCNIVGAMTSMMTFVHQVTYAINQDIGKIAAAFSLGIIGISGGFGKFFFGWLSDRIKDAKYSASLGYLLMALGMFALLKVKTVMGLTLFALIFGFGYGSMAPLMPYLLSDRFGRHMLGTAFGLLIFFVAGIGGAMGPLLGGIIFDATGTYAYAWQLNMIALLAVSLVILVLKPREKPLA